MFRGKIQQIFSNCSFFFPFKAAFCDVNCNYQHNRVGGLLSGNISVLPFLIAENSNENWIESFDGLNEGWLSKLFEIRSKNFTRRLWLWDAFSNDVIPPSNSDPFRKEVNTVLTGMYVEKMFNKHDIRKKWRDLIIHRQFWQTVPVPTRTIGKDSIGIQVFKKKKSTRRKHWRRNLTGINWRVWEENRWN